MSDKEKWVDLGEITPQFRLEGKKLQIQYPNEEWQDLADFSDVASSLDLRLNEKSKCVEIKRGEEWDILLDLSKLGGGIKTVELFSELPEDASENDVAIVETEEYIRTDTETVTLPIEVKAPEEDSEMPNIYNIKFKDRFDTLLNNDELAVLGAKMLNVELEFENCYLMYSDLSAETSLLQAGVSHPVRIININVSDEQMLFYVDGISIKDFLCLMMELELEEEQWVALLGSYANDKSEDSPSYGWISLTVSDAPLAENTALIEEGVYVTFNSDVEPPEINDFLGYVSIIAMNEKMESVLDIGADLYDYEDWEDEDTSTQTLILKCSNILFNHIAHGGVVTKSKEIYNPKGLFQKDKDKWVSLEEKMNTPRFVDTYFDLPKNSFENAIMAVMKESQFTSDAEETTEVKYGKTYKLLSADNLTADKFNSIVEGILPGYPASGYLSAELYFMQILPDDYNEMYFTVFREISEEVSLAGIMAQCYLGETPGRVSPSGKQYYTYRRIACFSEIMEGFDFGDMLPPREGEESSPVFNPVAGKWYWVDIIDDGKDYVYALDGVIHEGFPTDFQYELLFVGGCVSWDSSVYPVTRESSSDEGEKDLYQFDTKILHFVDSKGYITETYPSGFYRFTNGKWELVKAVSGFDFENKDILKIITAEDIGNIQENSRKRHDHGNKSYIDQINQESIDRLNQVPENTAVRHGHANKELLDSIGSDNVHKHENQELLDKITAQHANTQPGALPFGFTLFLDYTQDSYFKPIGTDFSDYCTPFGLGLNLNDSAFDISRFTYKQLHKGCSHITGKKEYVLKDTKGWYDITAYEMFMGCSSIEEIYLEFIEHVSFDQGVDLTNLCCGCTNLKKLTLRFTRRSSFGFPLYTSCMLKNTSALEEIALFGAVADSLNVHWSENLSVESILNLTKRSSVRGINSGVNGAGEKSTRTVVSIGTKNIEKLDENQLLSIVQSNTCTIV